MKLLIYINTHKFTPANTHTHSHTYIYINIHKKPVTAAAVTKLMKMKNFATSALASKIINNNNDHVKSKSEKIKRFRVYKFVINMKKIEKL